ncbi:MAG: sigma-70 family RNA polymerase sigma factor [Planctomycetales bacterium]|nr:sigma-70 family RNA polymerase sigma factor [Planctomycetales bacterium]
MVPETRLSLIMRLADKRDVDAWDQFVEIYEPLIFRLARSRGFQDADAREIVQDVMMSVSRTVEKWDPDRDKGRFRDWLFRAAKNWMIKYLTRRKHKILGSGDSGVVEILHQIEELPGPELDSIELEYRREVFRWASTRVKRKVHDRTWLAFWLTSVDGKECEQVAEELQMSVGAVHIARSRVRGRLRELIAQFDETEMHLNIEDSQEEHK